MRTRTEVAKEIEKYKKLIANENDEKQKRRYRKRLWYFKNYYERLEKDKQNRARRKSEKEIKQAEAFRILKSELALELAYSKYKDNREFFERSKNIYK